MPDAFPTLTVNPTMSTEYGTDISLVVLKLGDGNQQRVQDGINNNLGKYKLVYKMLETADFDTVVAFIDAHKGGEAITVVNLVIDITGATTGLFFISGYRYSASTSPILRDVEILLTEVAQ